MNDGAVLNINQIFEVVCCCKCGISFAVPAHIRAGWVNEGNNFYCPNGHQQSYSESEISRLKKKLALEIKSKEWAKQDASNANARADKSERRRIAQKGVATRLKNRAKAGVCPCCNRTFKQLASHMKNKHPEFNEATDK